MKIGDRCFVHGHVDEIRKDTVIVRNKGGYFGTDPGEVIVVNDMAHPNWVPCSEKLPKQSGEYLVTLRVGYLPGRVIVDVARYIVDVGEWKGMYKVIAWMPLPNPYKGGDSE